MKKLVLFTNGYFERIFFEELNKNEMPFLKEIKENRMNLTNGTRYTFEILQYSANEAFKIETLEYVMNFLNKSAKIESTMKVY